MGVERDETHSNGNGTSTRVWEFAWGGNLLTGVNFDNTLSVSGPITRADVENIRGGESSITGGGEGSEFVIVHSHSGPGFDGGACRATIVFRG
jgi:hypothetical protein